MEPFLLPSPMRAYLYNDVLLSWEGTKAVQRKETFSSEKILIACGFHVVSVNSAEELLIHEAALQHANFEKDEYLFFFNKSGKGHGSGYPCLMKRLRDTVAHGHYTSDTKGWIKIRHVFNDRTHIFGHVAMEKLVSLVEFMSVSEVKFGDE